MIQVTRDLERAAVKERETRALAEAVGFVKAKSALILCDANDAGFKVKNVPVEVRSTAQWLLEG